MKNLRYPKKNKAFMKLKNTFIDKFFNIPLLVVPLNYSIYVLY